MENLTRDMLAFMRDEGVGALMAKVEYWIPVLEELAELKAPGALEALAAVKSAYDTCRLQWLSDGVTEADWLRC